MPNFSELWQNFQTKYQTPSNLIQITATEVVTLTELLSFLKLPQDFKQSEVSISPEQITNIEVKEFLNQHKVSISLNIEKINQLKKIIESRDELFKFHLDPLFKDPLLCAYALPLYILNRISNNCLIDLLNFWAINQQKDFNILGIFPLVDSAGNFTPAANQLPINDLMSQDWLHLLWKLSYLDELRQFVHQVGLSQAMFYISDLGRYAVYDPTDLGSWIIDSTKMVMKIKWEGRECLLHLGRVAYEAINLVAFGNKAKKLKFYLGDLTKGDIAQGITRSRERRGSLGYIKINISPVHAMTRQTHRAVAIHDETHGQVLNRTPELFLTVTDKMAEVLRQSSNIKWSYEIFYLLEKDFGVLSKSMLDKLGLQSKTWETSQEIGEYFYLTFFESMRTFLFFEKYKNSQGLSKLVPTCSCFLVLLDMVTNRQEWVNIGFDPNHLIKEFLTLYDDIRDCNQFFHEADSPQLKFVKYLLIKHDVDKEKLQEFIAIINEHRENLSSRFQFTLLESKRTFAIRAGDKNNYNIVINDTLSLFYQSSDQLTLSEVFLIEAANLIDFLLSFKTNIAPLGGIEVDTKFYNPFTIIQPSGS